MLPSHMLSLLLAVWGPPNQEVTSASSCLIGCEPPSSHKSLELLFNPVIFWCIDKLKLQFMDECLVWFILNSFH